MGINISVQYNGGFLPDIILLTQGYYQWGTRLTGPHAFGPKSIYFIFWAQNIDETAT